MTENYANRLPENVKPHWRPAIRQDTVAKLQHSNFLCSWCFLVHQDVLIYEHLNLKLHSPYTLINMFCLYIVYQILDY